MKTLSTLWTLLWHSPKIIAILSLIKESFESDEFKEVLESLGNFFRKIAPPAPTTDSTGVIPADTKKEKRRRLLRFKDRLNVAGTLTDSETQEFCHQHSIYCAMDDYQWT